MNNRNSKGQFVTGHQIVGNRAGSIGPWHGKTRPDMSARHSESGNPMWKGDNVGYGGLHIWLRKTHGHESHCEHCGKTGKLEWALKTGYEYQRRRENFLRLCRSCHMKYDYANGTRKPKGHEEKSAETENTAQAI